LAILLAGISISLAIRFVSVMACVRGRISAEVTMYLRFAFWTGSMAYIAILFAHFAPDNGHSSPGVVPTAAFLGALLGFALGYMFANRAKRKTHLKS
jgi:hypothetical protein